MFLAGSLTQPEMIGLIAQAEIAERLHQTLMEEARWSPEQLFLITGYRVAINNLTI
jgi:hypothetical protein